MRNQKDQPRLIEVAFTTCNGGQSYILLSSKK